MPEETKVDINVVSKPALIVDLNDSYKGREIYSYARNIDSATHEGDVGTESNSMSNTFCVELPYKFIGVISLNDGTHVVFSGDDINSEIGRIDENLCTYTSIINSSCLGFKMYSPITGESKKLENDDIIITFRDDISPVRRLNINKIPYTYKEKDNACKTKVYNVGKLDCEEILLFPKIDIPNINLQVASGGSLANGTYAVAMCYNVNQIKYSDYYSITNRIHLFNTTGNNSFHVKLTNLDRNFDEYSLVVIQNSKGTRTAKVIGRYPTSYTDITISDFDSGTIILESELVVVKNTWQKAGLISANSNYLILADLTRRPELNYQKQAMALELEYTIEQVPEDYYVNSPEDIGYYRDENYSPSIQWLYDTGEFSPAFHIPGRKKGDDDIIPATGIDVYELDQTYPGCIVPEKVEAWQVVNTAGPIHFTNEKFICNRRFYGYGEMGYFESTEKYPDNIEEFGDDACTPIRIPKFPDENKIPRYSTIGGVLYLNILGMRIKNIKYPVDAQGKLVPGIVGYRIVRADRRGGNKSIIARGIATNVRKYRDEQNNKEIWYANYPYNDLNPDSFISKSQTVFKGGRERYFIPLTDYFTDKFNFYTPHGAFQPKYKMGGEFKFECEEIGQVEGQFEKVFGHPQLTLLTQFAFWIAAVTGIIESVLIIAGKHTDRAITKSGFSTGTAMPTYGDNSIENQYKIESVEDLIGLDIVGYIASQTKAAISIAGAAQLSTIQKIIKTVKTVLTVITAAGLKIPFAALKGVEYADNILAIIYNFTGPTDYAYQYNSHALFNKTAPVKKDNKRRKVIAQPEYLSSNLHSIRGTTFNNFGKQDSILIEINKPVKDFKNKDNTRRTISEFNIKDVNQKTSSQAVAFYATSKVNNENQYGQLGSVQNVLAHDNIIYIDANTNKNTSPIIYGGDCIITKYAIQTKHQFFSQNLATTINNELPTNFPPNTPYDYNLYRNIGYPRYWIDSTKYDFSQLISKKVMNNKTFAKDTHSKYNLDGKFKDETNVFRVDNAYFYTSNNGVMEFYVECDYNISFREKTKYPFYSKESSNLTEIFKAPFMWFPEEFKIDEGFRDLQTNEIFARQFRLNFKEIDNNKLRNRNAVIYSLPSFNLQAIDNWQYFLPGNYFSFNQSDFGNLTGIHKIDQERLIYLFDRSSPFISTGRDEIQTLDGRKVTIGDGGMFAREPREIMPTDVNYGSSQSKYAFSSNQGGYFYPSQTQGRLFNFTRTLDDITREGIYYWAKKYMPIQLYEKYPLMLKEENPLTSVGYHIAFDNNYEIVYFTKRDYLPKKEYENEITYNQASNDFSFNGFIIPLASNYFDDISWTISYSPKDNAFISWHDWHPDWIIQSENHFMSVKDNGIWKHNDTCQSFCNYYGKDYPFEIEYVDSDGQNVMIRKSIEYMMEAYHYRNNCRDKFHILNENFSNLRVHNSEQVSPLYNIVSHPKTKYGSIEYPKRNGQRYDILFAKKEQKYRINMIWDAIRDRGEFTQNEFHIWVNSPNGYTRIINPNAVDLDKPEEQRKKFRHYFTKFLFAKEFSGSTKYIMKFFNTKKNQSPI